MHSLLVNQDVTGNRIPTLSELLERVKSLKPKFEVGEEVYGDANSHKPYLSKDGPPPPQFFKGTVREIIFHDPFKGIRLARSIPKYEYSPDMETRDYYSYAIEDANGTKWYESQRESTLSKVIPREAIHNVTDYDS
jgi:hypothetical protein